MRLELRGRTERVPGGGRTERRCERCGSSSTFRERRGVGALAWTGRFDPHRHRVLGCGACGALVATDALGPPAPLLARTFTEAAPLPVAPEEVTPDPAAPPEVVAQAGQAVDEAAEVVKEAAEEARKGLGQVWSTLTGAPERPGSEAPGPPDEPPPRARAAWESEPDPEKRALLRRFAELEAQSKKRK
jgi:hypothetical protein